MEKLWSPLEMIQFLRSDDELALILGHELDHIAQGHASCGTTNNALLSYRE